jgi:hypothetical protein
MRLVGRFRRRKVVDQRDLPSGPTPPRPTLIGTHAANVVSGVRPDGTEVVVPVAGGGAALLFLTGACYGCRALWEGARDSGGSLPTRLPLVIVTPSPTTEDARVVAELAPVGIPVVMSSEAWHTYRVARAPWYVGAAGGAVVADGLAPETWPEMVVELARLNSLDVPGPPDAPDPPAG